MIKQRKIWIYSIITWAIFMIIVILISVKGRQTAEEPPVVETSTVTPQVIDVIIEEPVEETPKYEIDRSDVEMLARLTWGEARGCTTTEQAAVMWCVLNRVDSEDPLFPDTIQEVITQKNQFHGYNINNPIWPELEDLARDVLMRWLTNEEGRVLPLEYCWFSGDGLHNYFRDAYGLKKANIWDWSLESPYEN